MIGILIETNGRVCSKDFKDCKAYQEAVGGWLESLPLRAANLTAFVNEDGKINDLPYNPMATALCIALGAIFSDDHIAGNMVVVGPPDDNGDETAISEDKINKIVEVSRKIARDLGLTT